MPDKPEAVDRSTKVAPIITRRKVAMLEAGVTGLGIAKGLGITKQAVSDVIKGRKSTPRVQKAIADACGMDVEELFPAKAAEEPQASAA